MYFNACTTKFGGVSSKIDGAGTKLGSESIFFSASFL
jgi:hypothetical protein